MCLMHGSFCSIESFRLQLYKYDEKSLMDLLPLKDFKKYGLSICCYVRYIVTYVIISIISSET